MKEKLYTKISSLIDAIKTCEKKGNIEWSIKHKKTLTDLQNKLDFNAIIDINRSTPERLELFFSYEIINDNGYSDGYKDYTIVVKPSLQFGLNIRVVGKNINDIKDYFYDVFYTALNEEME